MTNYCILYIIIVCVEQEEFDDHQGKIDRINELAAKAKTEDGLTEEEIKNGTSCVKNTFRPYEAM